MNALVKTTGTVPAIAEQAEMATQFLTFVVDGDTYGVGILAVREIMEYVDVTAVPMMPSCIRGVINVRGAVVPVMDLVVRFGRPPSAVSKRTCIVIIEKEGDSGNMLVGMLVDAVNAVLDIPAGDIEPVPAFGTRVRRELVAGMGKVNGKFVVLLDTEQVMSDEDIANLIQQRDMVAATADVLQ